MTAAVRMVARAVRAPQEGEVPRETLVLSYEDRLVRRKRLLAASGAAILVDLAQTVSLEPGQVLELDDGGCVAVQAADEDLIEVTGPLAQLAWHIGNRHTPCEIDEARIVIRAEKVMADMLAGLGAGLRPFRGPFRPGGGAYGHGRVMGHTHAHDDGHSHTHSHSHSHSHTHEH